MYSGFSENKGTKKKYMPLYKIVKTIILLNGSFRQEDV